MLQITYSVIETFNGGTSGGKSEQKTLGAPDALTPQASARSTLRVESFFHDR